MLNVETKLQKVALVVRLCEVQQMVLVGGRQSSTEILKRKRWRVAMYRGRVGVQRTMFGKSRRGRKEEEKRWQWKRCYTAALAGGLLALFRLRRHATGAINTTPFLSRKFISVAVHCGVVCGASARKARCDVALAVD
jgi:hypothetical protein